MEDSIIVHFYSYRVFGEKTADSPFEFMYEPDNQLDIDKLIKEITGCRIGYESIVITEGEGVYPVKVFTMATNIQKRPAAGHSGKRATMLHTAIHHNHSLPEFDLLGRSTFAVPSRRTLCPSMYVTGTKKNGR